MPRGVAVALEPAIATHIEALLATANAVLATDYYQIDMRFGRRLRLDAMIVEAVDLRKRVKGARVQVRDDENRNRQEGTSYLDLEELTRLSRGLRSMADLTRNGPALTTGAPTSCRLRAQAASGSRSASRPACPGLSLDRAFRSSRHLD